MLKADELPESWITVHRAMQGHFDRCLDVGLDATKDDPLARWVGPGRDQRRRYMGYVLAQGFKKGRVILGQPRAGVCVASQVGRTWSPYVLWNRLRLLATLSSEQRARLRHVEAAVDEHAAAGALWVRCLAVRPKFRKKGLGSRLLRQAVGAAEDAPVLVHTVQKRLAQEIEGRGGEALDVLRIGEDTGPLLLYRVAPRGLTRSLKAAA
jgi:GNAT superfamily N-acetyltransferase